MNAGQRTIAILGIATAVAAPFEGLPTPAILFCRKFPDRVPRNFGPNRAYWSRRGFLRAPPTGRDPIVHDRDWNPMHLSDLRPRGFVVSHANDFSVSRLFLSRGPSAVIGAVADIIVDAFNGQIVRVSRRQRPTVEHLELPPLCAHRYAFAAVVLVGDVFAPCVHVFPAHIEPGSRLAVSFCSIYQRRSRSRAPARKALSMTKVCASNNFVGSAIADAVPQGSSTSLVSGLIEHMPSSKTRSSDVDQSGIFCHI